MTRPPNAPPAPSDVATDVRPRPDVARRLHLVRDDAAEPSGVRPRPGPFVRTDTDLHVQVLLATYNGARYLPELLASLTAQSHRHVDLLVRDDGSTDGTVAILDAYARDHAATIHAAPHVGLPDSFLLLLRDADPSADLYAFCDQDDVWLSDKIGGGVQRFAKLDPARPALYCARLRPVDAQLAPLTEFAVPRRALGFANALVENRTSGCTMLLNRAARALLIDYLPRAAQMHDHWAYLVVSAFGTIHYDPEPRLWYRQHGQNAVGARRTLGAYVERLRQLQHRGWMSRIFAQAEEFATVYGASLEPARRRVLDRFLGSRDGLVRRLTYAASPDVYRQERSDDVALRLMLALGLR